MASELTAAPALSTPAEHLFEHVRPEVSAADDESQVRKRSSQELREIYEIDRTAREIRSAKRRRIALQFPDSMLGDAPWVVEALKSELKASCVLLPEINGNRSAEESRKDSAAPPAATLGSESRPDQSLVDIQLERIYILADTSYSACCVDEIAAEHVDADVVVHYGRSCLSPTSRLPVIYVFTKHLLDESSVLETFARDFEDKQSPVVLMADVTYQTHVAGIASLLRDRGYDRLLSTAISHNPLGRIPNRVISDHDGVDISADVDLHQYSVFHISQPPTALLLALSSRIKALHIFPTVASESSPAVSTTLSTMQTTRRLLGRRYARVLTLASAGVIGVLVNTLSVSDYKPAIDRIRNQIAAAGKKSYTMVVGKLNPAKLANFAEIDGWVAVGCWESSLVEDEDGAGAGFFKPVVTPFELEAALMGDDKRVWSGEWWGGIESIREIGAEDVNASGEKGLQNRDDSEADLSGDEMDDDESAPPEFDLRTGKLIATSRPIRSARGAPRSSKEREPEAASPITQSSALALRPRSEVAVVNGVVSPGAEFLRSQRTWRGLGSDHDRIESSAAIEEGRSGIARGYTVGDYEQRS